MVEALRQQLRASEAELRRAREQVIFCEVAWHELLPHHERSLPLASTADGLCKARFPYLC